MFVKTETILDKILAHKLDEVAAYRARQPLDAVLHAAAEATPVRDFAAALHAGQHIALIAEVKKASPSKGVLLEAFDPVALGTLYAVHGAAAISVLTDEHFFQGAFAYLSSVRAAVSVPVLCKEFVLDRYQVALARAHHADAVLLIAAALDDARLTDLHAEIVGHGMAALVEVHNEVELERALKLGAQVIGINNRDLKTFHEDLSITERLARQIPPEITLVAESAVRSAADVARMAAAGVHAVLVGEGLLRSADIGVQVHLFSSQSRSAHQ